MAWVHDTGYPPAYEHSGYPATVLLDGTETPVVSSRIAASVIGWRAACDCGWRGAQFYPRCEFPSPTGLAPELVDGFDTFTGTYAEWDLHLARVLPELKIHDRAQQLRAAETRLHQAISTARHVGLTWSRIDRITRQAGIEIRRPAGASDRSVGGGRLSPQHRGDQSRRPPDGPARGPS
jgi:hypothetical protein